MLQAKAELREELLDSVKRGKKSLKDQRRLALIKGVSSLPARQISMEDDRPGKGAGPSEESLEAPLEIPSFEAFDLQSRDGWEKRR